MNATIPQLPPQFGKLVALWRSSTYEAERATARLKAEALLPAEAGGFERALRILAYREALAKARPGNFLAGFDEFTEIDNPGHMAREAAKRAEKRRAWHRRRDELVARYGSLEAVLAPCEREKALRKALAPWRVAGKRPHQRWTRELKGWDSLTLVKKMPAAMRAALEGALPMPVTFAEAQAELAFWRERDDDMQHALSMSEDLLGDSGLDRMCIARMELIRDVVEHEMRLVTLPEILERFRMFRARESLDEPELEEAIFRDLEAMVGREEADA